VPVDDLNAPLGQNVGKKPRAPVAIPWALIAGVLALAVLAAAAGRLLLIRPTSPTPTAPPVLAAPEHDRPERTGSVSEKTAPEAGRTDVIPAAPTPDAAKPNAQATQTITIIDGTSGRREQIVVPIAPVPKP
jgi:hypothetical protein